MASPSAEAVSTPTALPDQPNTSNSDDGLSRRPRDARLIHLILSSLGIHSYQERVPLQLLDFAYRYTSSVLSDSLRLAAEGYAAAPGGGTGANRRGAAGAAAADAANTDGGNISVNALRQAIASRQDYQFQGPLPKEFMLEQAAEKNRTVLPRVERAWGMQLPPERYCLTGTGWGLKDEWESEGEDEEMSGVTNGKAAVVETNGNGVAAATEEANGEGEEDEGTFEDVFGGGDEDREMDDA